MNSTFHVIDKASWERSAHFDYYFSQIKCRYNLNASIVITNLVKKQKERRLKFFPAMLYAILKAVNQNKEFRMSFNEQGEIGYWEEVVPCYTLFHDENKTFTDIWSEYDERFEVFYHTVVGDMRRFGGVAGAATGVMTGAATGITAGGLAGAAAGGTMSATIGGIKARPGQPANFCPVSCLPWLSFTSFAQDTYTESSFLFPLIKFGKYVEDGNQIRLPVSVFVSHAVADGYHTCKLINDMQEIAQSF